MTALLDACLAAAIIAVAGLSLVLRRAHRDLARLARQNAELRARIREANRTADNFAAREQRLRERLARLESRGGMEAIAAAVGFTQEPTLTPREQAVLAALDFQPTNDPEAQP